MINRTSGVRPFIVGTLGMALLLSLMPITSSAQLEQRQVDEANAHWFAQRYRESIPGYRQHLRANPKDGSAWYRLGYAYMSVGNDAESLRCFNKSIEFKYALMNSQYNIACAHAKLGDFETAITELEKAIDFGFTQTNRIASDNDFDGMKSAELATARISNEFQRLVSRTRNPIEHYEGGNQINNLSGVWSIATEDGKTGRATGNVFAKGFAHQLDVDFEGKRYLHLSLQFSASENKWYVAGGDIDGTAYTGFADASTNRVEIEGKRATGAPTRLSIVWSDDEHADLEIEDKIDGSWQARSTMQFTQTFN